MVKLFALSIFYKGSKEATLLNAAYELQSFTYFQRKSAKEFLGFSSKTILEHTELACRQSVKQDGYSCHAYVRADNVGAVLISDDEYPQIVAHTLITKVLDDFITKVPAEQLSVAVESSINFTDLPAYLAKYQDPTEADPMMKVEKEIDETKIILKKSIESVLERGEKLEDLIDMTDKLSSETKTFYKAAKSTNSCCSFS